MGKRCAWLGTEAESANGEVLSGGEEGVMTAAVVDQFVFNGVRRVGRLEWVVGGRQRTLDRGKCSIGRCSPRAAVHGVQRHGVFRASHAQSFVRSRPSTVCRPTRASPLSPKQTRSSTDVSYDTRRTQT